MYAISPEAWNILIVNASLVLLEFEIRKNWFSQITHVYLFSLIVKPSLIKQSSFP